MRLIGQLDSPYVRRVAISLHHLGIGFEHEALSVFRDMDEFGQINPLIKAPTLVTDSNEVLMDSTLILEYAERIAAQKQTKLSLIPSAISDHERALRLVGLAINACDKSVQLFYERELRPTEKQHQPWIDRVKTQLTAAYDLLEDYAAQTSSWLIGTALTQADITVAVAWQFTQLVVADAVNRAQYPALCELSSRAEALPVFQTYPLTPDFHQRMAAAQNGSERRD